ncbi:MAG: phosphate ABC transporter permease subunit PstC [Prevotellaceae bacterium]|jgi:phosphate transport system permease protein|nr:phosphate ABC transporter permease subunit PstC [Prevotellaceae bacterium]
MTGVRILKERIASGIMFFLTLITMSLVVVMGIGLYIKSMPVFENYSLSELLFSSSWKPMRGEFGFLPFIMGTIWVTVIAVIIAVPVSLLTAIYLTEYAKPNIRKYVFPALDILAGLPSVIYGVWGSLLIVPLIASKLAPHFVEFSTGYTVLAGAIVLGVMILPLLISLFIELFTSVSEELREASISLGATKWQTTKSVVLKKTLPGITAAIVLAVSRALGETIAVLMVCGNLPEAPRSIFNACYPLPALIANNYGEMLSLPFYEAALMFAALILFVVVLLFNLASRMILYKVEDER